MVVSEPWAFGYQRFGNEKLPDHLLAIARHRANRALSNLDSGSFSFRWDDDDATIQWLDRAVDAGTAVEIMCKHILAKITPVLIMDPKKTSTKNILHLTGNTDIVANQQKSNGSRPIDALTVPTIMANEAAQVVKELWSSSAEFNVADAIKVLNVRNAAIHLGMIGRTTLLATLLSFVDVMSALVTEAGLSASQFWTVSLSSAEQRIRSNSPVSHVLQHKLDQAISVATSKPRSPDNGRDPEAAEWFTSEDPGELATLLNRADLPHWRQMRCPICNEKAVMWGSLEHAYVDHDTDEETGREVFWVDEEATPELFRCTFCGLQLNSHEIAEYGIANRRFSERWLVGTRDPTDDEMSAFYGPYA